MHRRYRRRSRLCSSPIRPRTWPRAHQASLPLLCRSPTTRLHRQSQYLLHHHRGVIHQTRSAGEYRHQHQQTRPPPHRPKHHNRAQTSAGPSDLACTRTADRMRKDLRLMSMRRTRFSKSSTRSLLQLRLPRQSRPPALPTALRDRLHQLASVVDRRSSRPASNRISIRWQLRAPPRERPITDTRISSLSTSTRRTAIAPSGRRCAQHQHGRPEMRRVLVKMELRGLHLRA